MPPDRRRARELAQQAVAAGRPVAWFEQLYVEAAEGHATVPWDDRAPNPHVVAWLDAHADLAPAGRRALDVGCGRGDTAEELARRGYRVTAFDVAPSAVAQARARFPGSIVDYAVADVLALPAGWRRGFELVVEAYTLQVLPPRERAIAAAAIADQVAPGGVLLVVARAREPDDDPGAMPWPLTRAEVEAIAGGDLRLHAIDAVLDDEDPPVRRWIASFVRERMP